MPEEEGDAEYAEREEDQVEEEEPILRDWKRHLSVRKTQTFS